MRWLWKWLTRWFGGRHEAPQTPPQAPRPPKPQPPPAVKPKGGVTVDPNAWWYDPEVLNKLIKRIREL